MANGESMSHTPGPWKVDSTGCIVSGEDHHVVCFGHDYDDYGRIQASQDLDEKSAVAEIEANAHLIAAAPDLLEACKAALGAVSDFKELRATQKMLRAAIAKAAGQ